MKTHFWYKIIIYWSVCVCVNKKKMGMDHSLQRLSPQNLFMEWSKLIVQIKLYWIITTVGIMQ